MESPIGETDIQGEDCNYSVYPYLIKHEEIIPDILPIHNAPFTLTTLFCLVTVATMNQMPVTLYLPEDVYRRLQRFAQAAERPLEDVISQTIRANLPPFSDDLPPEVQNELASLQNLSDEALWQITQTPIPPRQWKRHQSLLEKGEAGSLTDEEQEQLAHFREATDRFVLRRSYAFALLKWRGYSLSIPSSPSHAIPPQNS